MGSISLSSKYYVTTEDIRRTTIADYAPAISDTGQQRRNSRVGASSYAFDFSNGFGVDKLDPTNPAHQGKFYDSECETRFAGQVTPPLLVNTATQEEVHTDGAATNYAIEHMENFKSNLYGLVRNYLTGGANNDYELRVAKFDPDHATTQWDDVAGRIRGSTTIYQLGDLKRHGTTLYISCNDGASWRLCYSTDGSNWTTAADNDNIVAWGASDEAGPLLSFGTTLLIAIWDNSAGNVIVYKTTDITGVDPWTAVCSIASAGPALGMTSWVDQDGNDVPWIRLRESWGQIDLTNSVYRPIVNVPAEQSTASGLEVWAGQLMVPEQEGFNRCYYSNGELVVISMGLNDGAGVIAEKQGYVTAIARTNQWLFVAYGGLAANKKACVFALDKNFNWHYVAKHGTANQRITCLAISSSDDNLTRLHYHVLTATNQTTGYYLDYILDNPKQNASMKFETGKTITTPQFGGDEPELNGCLYRLDMDADSLTADETIGVKYGVNGAAVTSTISPSTTFTSADYDLLFASGEGVAAKRVQFEYTLNRAAGTNTNRPIMYGSTIYYEKLSARRFSAEFIIDLKATLSDAAHGAQRDEETIISEIETLLDTVTLVPFKESDSTGVTTRYVRVREAGFVTGAKWSVNKAYLNKRTGFIAVRLEEPI